MKTTKSMISVILLLGMVSSAFAVDSNWNNNSGDRLWRNGSNWSDGVPTTADKAGIRASILGPIIDASTTATADMVAVGDWGNTDSLDITGGTLTTGDWFILGHGASDDGTFNVSGGTTTCGENLSVGYKGTGHINMTSGTVTVNDTFRISVNFDGNASSGDVQLDGGTISCNAFSMATGATMSIGNTGILEINGDATVTVNSYITSGWLTGYGGSGTLSVDYDFTTTGKTTVVANPPEKAAYPTPGNGENDASVHSDLSWTAGIYATSHDVYFGTDPTPDATEFMGNQTETTFDPGVLDLNTTYYWRIDGVDTGTQGSPWTGNVWSFTTQATSSNGKIIYPWNATTAIVKAGESFEVWFDADPGQTVTSVELSGPYNTVYPSMGSPVTGSWVYDTDSGNTYNTLITVTVPSDAPADRYDLLLNTSYGQAISVRAVKVVKEYKANYSVLHISDTHLKGGASENNWLLEKRLTAVVNMSNIIDPEMVFVTGDNLYYTTGDFQSRVDHLFDGEESEGLKGLHDMQAATFVAIGNHDIDEGGPGFTWGAPYDVKARQWNQYYGIQYHAFKYGNGRCMVINNGWNGYNRAPQYTEMNSWLAGAGSGGNFRLGAYHKWQTEKTWASNNDLDLALSGHNHHKGPGNPWSSGDRGLIEYVAPSGQGYCEFNLFQINNATGNYTALGRLNTDAATAGYGLPTGNCRVLENNSEKGNSDTSVWIYNLTLDYANANDGTSSTNTATIENKFNFAIPGARVRFVMPNGMNYAVSQGTIAQQFDGDSFHIVDVSVDIGASSTTVIEIIQNVNIYGDINNDRIVNYEDLAPFGSKWLDTGCGTCGGADYTGDGDVTIDDLVTMAQNWLADYTLIAYWKLDETAGSIASDSSRNGYDGTLMNTDDSDWVPGKTSNALNFDGADNYVVADAVCAEIAGGDVTVSAWMKADTLNLANQFIIATNSSAGDNKLMFGTQANTATLSFVDSEPLWRDTTATVIDNTWHHIAYVLDDSADTVTIYVDGGQALSFASTVSLAADDLFSLGQEYDAGLTTGDFYNGRLDDVRVYNYALSDTEIRRLHDPSGLIAHWKLDETSGTVAENDATYGYDGTLVNMDDSDWVGGNTGNALDFDGVNDHVVADDICAAMAGKDVTVSAWVKAPAVNPATQFIISINTSTGDNRLLCGTPAGTATLSLGDTAWHDTTATVIDNTWHHIAYVLEDSSDTITVYVDGSDVLSFGSTISIAATDLLSLGQEYDPPMTPGDFYSGLLDDVRIYDRALTESEIATLAQ